MHAQIFEIAVGQTVWLWPTGNNAFGKKDIQPMEGTIIQIARKYFYVQILGHAEKYAEKFLRENFSSQADDRNAGYLIFPTKEAALDNVQCDIQLKEIRRCLDRNISIQNDAVHQIYHILKQQGCIKEGD